MNFIREIREIIDDRNEVVKFAFWNHEMAVYVGEKEIPISVLTHQTSTFDNIVLDVEGYDWKLRGFQLTQLGKIMACLQEHMAEIRELTEEIVE